MLSCRRTIRRSPLVAYRNRFSNLKFEYFQSCDLVAGLLLLTTAHLTGGATLSALLRELSTEGAILLIAVSELS